MPAPMIVPMTPDLAVSDNYIIQVTALDQSTGALVSGVKISNVVICGRDVSGSDTAPTIAPSPVTGAYTSE